MTVFRAATLRTFFFAFHVRAKELNPGFMTHFKILNATYSKIVFCDFVTFVLSPSNFFCNKVGCILRRKVGFTNLSK